MSIPAPVSIQMAHHNSGLTVPLERLLEEQDQTDAGDDIE